MYAKKKEKENDVTKLWLKKSYIDQVVHTLMNRGQEVEVSIANQKELI